MATAFVYGSVLTDAFSGSINFPAATVQAILCASTYTPNQDTHSRLSSLTGELSGGGYARQTLASKSLTYDAASNTLTISCANVVFPAVTGTFRYAIFAINTGTASTSPLLICVDYLTDQTVTAQDVQLTTPVNGLLQCATA
jgi:hypothetical protein